MSNTAQYNRGVPGVPLAALDAIQDQNTRQVLRAIVDGWHVRNGASGNGDGRFVTQGELGSSTGYRLIGGIGSNYQSSNDKVSNLTAADINRLVTDVQASVMTSALWNELGERIRLIDLSVMIEQNARIEAVQAVAANLVVQANKLKDEETARIAAVKKVADDLTTETTTRVTAVNKAASDLTKVASDLATEAATRLNFDNVSGSRISTLESTTSTQATQISGLTTRVTSAENTIVSINSTNASQASTLTSLTTRIGTAESSINTLNTTTANQASSITSLSNRVGSAESTITALNKASSDQATSLNSLTTRVGTAESTISTLNTTTANQASTISALTTRVGTSESSITNLNKTTSDQATTLTSLTNRVGTAESKITNLQTSDSAQATTLATLTTKMASAESSISTLNTTTTAQATSITTLNTKVSSAETNITNITKTTSDQATALASLTTRVGTNESSITALNTTTSTQATSLSSLTTRVGTAETKITNLQTTTDTQTTTLNSLSTRVGSAESTISTLNTTTANQANTLTLLSTTINKKNRTFIQATAPVSTSDYTLKTSDFWFNTADKNKAYQWDGAQWLECSDGRIAESVGAISSEATTRSNADNALTTLINTQVSTINNSIAALQTTTTTLSNSVSALTSQTTTLQSTVNGHTTALSQEITTRVDNDNWLLAKWEVKTDINGYISGFGLAQDAKQNATPYSRFIVRADQFAIGSPSGPGITAAVPFVVQTTPTTLNGQYVAPGVYMDTAVIKNGAIGYAKIGVAEIDTLLIKGDAITVPSSLNIYASPTLPRGGWLEVGRMYVDFGTVAPPKVVLMCFANFLTTGGYTGGNTIALYAEHVGGQQTPQAGLYTASSITASSIGAITGVGAGVQAFRMMAFNATYGFDFYVGSGNLTVIGVKR